MCHESRCMLGSAVARAGTVRNEGRCGRRIYRAQGAGMRRPMRDNLVFTVAELTRHIKDCLEPQYRDIWVQGEISNLRSPSSGHCYFTLKDEQSQIRAVMFRAKLRALRFGPENGLSVVCRGRINVYEPRGEYQLLVEMMEPRGIGDLQLAFEQLRLKLESEGLFAAGHKKPLPLLPSKIALVTSPTGAALRDMLNIIYRRFPGVASVIVPVKVQGDEAPGEIAAAVARASRLRLADVVIVARGGGSLEDLWAFNTEEVARALFASEIPVVSAVGHEIDFTIADFVADARAPTPSAAAELVVREKSEMQRTVSHLLFRLKNVLCSCIDRNRAALKYLNSCLRSPVRNITDCRLRHDDLHMRLMQTLPRLVTCRKADIDSLRGAMLCRAPRGIVRNGRVTLSYLGRRLSDSLRVSRDSRSLLFRNALARLNAVNPLQVLERGYSITRAVPSMEVIRDAAAVRKGDLVEVTVNRGTLDCEVRKAST